LLGAADDGDLRFSGADGAATDSSPPGDARPPDVVATCDAGRCILDVPADDDTYVGNTSAAQGTVFSRDPVVQVSCDTSGSELVGLLRFDVGKVPADVTIDEVKLVLQIPSGISEPNGGDVASEGDRAGVGQR
jgi:hypothetical protein